MERCAVVLGCGLPHLGTGYRRSARRTGGGRGGAAAITLIVQRSKRLGFNKASGEDLEP